jgi:hypothetical protein
LGSFRKNPKAAIAPVEQMVSPPVVSEFEIGAMKTPRTTSTAQNRKLGSFRKRQRAAIGPVGQVIILSGPPG